LQKVLQEWVSDCLGDEGHAYTNADEAGALLDETLRQANIAPAEKSLLGLDVENTSVLCQQAVMLCYSRIDGCAEPVRAASLRIVCCAYNR
jgi:hypothetical protein